MKKICSLFYFELTIFLFLIIHPSLVNATTPTISNISVSVSETSATITWTTDQDTDSKINYGLSGEYTESVSDSTYVTSHSLTPSGLTKNTAYDYQIISVNSIGESVFSEELTFTTSGSSTTTTTTTTVTKIITATPLPSPTPDKVPPAVALKTDFKKNYTRAPEIEGSASDVSGVASLEYSLDDGKNWLPVRQIGSIYGKSTSFSFTLPALFDGTYKIKIRARDGKGNSGSTGAKFLTIDRLPPKVGASLFTVGPQVLLNNQSNSISLLSGIPARIYLSAVGGPDEINLSLSPLGLPNLSTAQVKMSKNPETGLWLAELNVKDPGRYRVSSTSIDGADNQSKRLVSNIEILPPGMVSSNGLPIKNTQIVIYVLDPLSGRFTQFDGSSFDIENPVTTDNNGRYGFYLPAGTYYLSVNSPHRQKARTEIFSLKTPTAFNSDFTLPQQSKLKIGTVSFPVPRLFPAILPLNLKTAISVSSNNLEKLIGQPFPEFNLLYQDAEINQFTFRGQAQLLTLLNTWTPQTFDQLAALNLIQKEKLVKSLIIVPQESSEEVLLFRKRGDYLIPIVADPDGILLEKLDITSLPVHFLLDRAGIIKKTKIGLLSQDNLSGFLYE